MGKIDTESRNYVSNPDIFADVFNYFLYNGEDVIKPENLHPYDTAEIAIPHGNKGRKPIQKYRDSFKVWNVMSDGECVYVLLGAEIQNNIHYAMPVKTGLYDFIDYADQVDKKSKEYHSKKNEADISVDEDAVKIKLTSDEFLSGFRKEDKLMPVITVVVYFGSEKWDGPLSLHEMLDYRDSRILRAIPDYRINLIAPANMPDKDFDEKFKTGLGLVLNTLKHSKTNPLDVLRNTHRTLIDRKSAEFIRDVLGVPFEFEDKDSNAKGDVDMNEATKKYLLKIKIEGAVEALKDEGYSDQEIVDRITKKYGVTEQYVLEILHPAA